MTEKRRVRMKEDAREQPALDGLLGLAVGDALGVPYENSWREELRKEPAVDMIGYRAHNQPEGSWSDDTSMALCVADSLRRGFVDPDDMMKRFSAWMTRRQYTATGVRFDVGLTCRKAIARYEEGVDPSLCGDYSEAGNGNGGLMRIFPVALYQSLRADRSDEAAFDFLRPVHLCSSLTHGHERGLICCGIYTLMLDEWMHGDERDSLLEAFSRGFERARRIYTRMGGTFEEEMNTPGLFVHPRELAAYPINRLETSGYAVHTLHAAVWCLLTTDNYRDCVLKAVNMGRDTDTTAAVAGALAGVIYGREAIPAPWLEKLKNTRLIQQIAGALDAAIAGGQQEKTVVDSFTGEHAHMAFKAGPCFEYGDIRYENAQAAYLAQAAPEEERARFAVLTAHQARRLFKQLTVREGWEAEREETLYLVLLEKYRQNADIRKRLLSTGDMDIICDTTGSHDNEWGRCACAACKGTEAKNLYGRTLMRVRAALAGD